MERLTFDGNFCDISKCGYRVCPYDGDCTQKEVWERLKAYEDAGLSPQACAQAAEIEKQLDSYGFSAKKMLEFIKADKDGRVLILPCKRGDELWAYGDFQRGWEVYKITVSDLSTLNGRTVLNTNGFETIRPEDIGKTVFLTREEAEKALQEMEGKA